MPTTIAEMARRFRALDLTAMGRAVIERSGPELTDYNRVRLMKGLGTDGNFLSPRISEDPYWNTHGGKRAAYGYAMYKHQRSGAPFDIANLRINGYTHNRIRVEVGGNTVGFKAYVPWGDEVQTKYGGKAFGLSEDDKYKFRKDTLHPALARAIAAQTGAKTRTG